MATYISILRGINVGGHNQIKMEALRQMYVNLGFTAVQTYIQSGNVIFRTESTDNPTLEKIISAKILETFEFKVPVLILTIEELREALAHNPFTTVDLKDPATVYLTFLSALPDKSLLNKIIPENFLPDEFRHSGKVIYNYCPNGYGNTKLNNTFFENKLKLTATSRNLRTSKELLTIAEKI